jgi:hypothetical protein
MGVMDGISTYKQSHNIADPGSGAFLSPGSRIQNPGWKKSQSQDPGSGFQDEHSGS